MYKNVFNPLRMCNSNTSLHFLRLPRSCCRHMQSFTSSSMCCCFAMMAKILFNHKLFMITGFALYPIMSIFPYITWLKWVAQCSAAPVSLTVCAWPCCIHASSLRVFYLACLLSTPNTRLALNQKHDNESWRHVLAMKGSRSGSVSESLFG